MRHLDLLLQLQGEMFTGLLQDIVSIFHFNFYCCHGFNFHVGFFVDAKLQTVFSLSNIFPEMATGGHQSNRVSLGSVRLSKMNRQNGFNRRDT